MKFFNLANVKVKGPLSRQQDAELSFIKFSESTLYFVLLGVLTNKISLNRENSTEALTF